MATHASRVAGVAPARVARVGDLAIELGPDAPLAKTLSASGRAPAKRVDRKHPIQADVIA